MQARSLFLLLCAQRFALVLIPVYEDPGDAADAPYTLQNAEPFTWQWLSTINRVNSQVQKVCPSHGYVNDRVSTLRL